MAATMRIVNVLPLHLDADSMRGVGLTAGEYRVLATLSEAPHRQRRMTDLVNGAGLSASRTTRLVDDLPSRGLVKSMGLPLLLQRAS